MPTGATARAAEPPSPWALEQVEALCPTLSRLAAARTVAAPDHWRDLGVDTRALWGRYAGGAGEPYEVVVDHVRVATRCSCPARARPCKHALALLLLWVAGAVPTTGEAPPAGVAGWLERAQPPAAAEAGPAGEQPATAGTGGAAGRSAAPAPERDRARDDKVARLSTALVELDRWLADRVRTGLAEPALARYATWDAVAARLVDAKAGSLANRVRRLGGQVGTAPGWHEHVLAELGVLHLLAEGGQRLGELEPHLADGIAVALGWQVRQSDVLAGVPERDRWLVAGRSDTVEDRIVVRRTWMWGTTSAEWAMVLAFAAHGQALDETLRVGTSIEADLYRYPGAVRLRALVGHVHDPARPEPRLADLLPAGSLGQVCDDVGAALCREPWLERHPFVVRARAVPARRGRSWLLADAQGSLPLLPACPGLAELVACTAHEPVPVTAEWTARGVLPVAVHLAGRSVELTPRLDEGGRWR